MMNALRLAFLVLGMAADIADGFSPRRLPHHPAISLRDSLFGDIFDFDDAGRSTGSEVQKAAYRPPPGNYNDDAPPFSEAETASARTRRMEMARELQKSFYREPAVDPPAVSATSPLLLQPSAAKAGGSSDGLTYGSSVLRNLPTLTSHDGVQGQDEAAILPGYQYKWTITHPQQNHMFHTILSGPAPWHFAHVYLPNEPKSISAEVANVQSYNDIQDHLRSEDGPPLFGTLLRITDRRFRDEDGSIVLAVQAIDRLRVDSVASAPGTYLCTNVQLSPEDELMKPHLTKALLSSASYLSGLRSDPGDDGSEMDDALSSPSAVNGAARAAATAETVRVRKFEYLPVFLEEKPRPPSSAKSLRSNASDSNATKRIKDAIRKQDEAKENLGPEYADVAQLVNYDAFGFGNLGIADSATSQALKRYWNQMAEETAARHSRSFNEEDNMFDASGTESSSSFFIPEPTLTQSSSSSPPPSVESTLIAEREMWKTLDEMIRLLSFATSATMPLPSQILGLLPKRDDWPHEFVLENYAQASTTSRGTPIDSKQFVRVDKFTETSKSSYPSIRRAQRLSYVIWLLLEGLSVSGAQPAPPSRDVILNMSSIEERLKVANMTLEGINFILKRMIAENRKGDEEK